jgi:hypothetical protein
MTGMYMYALLISFTFFMFSSHVLINGRADVVQFSVIWTSTSPHELGASRTRLVHTVVLSRHGIDVQLSRMLSMLCTEDWFSQYERIAADTRVAGAHAAAKAVQKANAATFAIHTTRGPAPSSGM